MQNKKRVQHSVDILIKNLSEIIDNNPVEDDRNDDNITTSNIRPSETRKDFFELEKEKLKNKLLAQREKLKISKKKEKYEKYSKNVQSLVNMKIKHKCVTDSGTEWFEGRDIFRNKVTMRE